VDFDDAGVGLHDVDHQIGPLALQAHGEAAPFAFVRRVLGFAPQARCRIIGAEGVVIAYRPGAEGLAQLARQAQVLGREAAVEVLIERL
jgi:hypothetical protein